MFVGGAPLATGRLLDGGAGNGLPTWADIKAQARDILGIELTDGDIFNIPLLRTDAYGEFIRGPNNMPQIVVHIGADSIPNTDDDIVVEGNLTTPVNTFTATNGGFAGAVRVGHAFLDDIAHNAVPVFVNGQLAPDADADTGNTVAVNPQTGRNIEYDDELLNRHYITGDGRGNENIGLTTVHHVFHSEHNRQTEAQKLTILQSGDTAFINEWLAQPLTAQQQADLQAVLSVPSIQQLAFAETLLWDGERIFQAARFATEMQYQHLVFEEFARKIQPAIDPFVFNSVTDINPAIFAEFANTVYRFGHSMLTDGMPRLDANSQPINPDIGLIEAFLNPVEFDLNGTISHDAAAAAIVRGMTIEHGNAIDEFVVGSLRNNLLGLPLDLAAINIARGRDTGIPSLNDARAQLYAATGSTFLTPYDSWVDFAANLKNPMSVVNFIAAYGLHDLVESETTLAGKRAAAMAIALGQDQTIDDANTPGGTRTIFVPADRVDFLNSTDGWSATTSGLNLIDLWIGGLAEKIMPFGGMLGSTFNAIFEAQLENLQDGDRFYYLTRTQGQNLLNQLEQNSFSKMILANTELAQPGADQIRGTADDIIARHIGVDSFAKYDYVLEVAEANQAYADPLGNDPVLEALGLGKVIRDDPRTAAVETNYLRFTGGEHIAGGGTNDADTIITDFGDDAIWGDDGNDRIESGAGVDLVNGGGGDDILTDSGDTGDFLKGEEGNDVIANSNGLDVLMGGDGKDAVFVGVDDTEVFGGAGDDFILGGDGRDFLLGNEGDDWMEGGGGFDTLAGDNSELFFNSAIVGHDVLFAGNEEQDFDAESGDDIMVQGESVMRNEGMFGFDWAIFKGVPLNGYADMRIKIFTTEEQDILRNRFDKVEALSGWNFNDTLIGDDRVFGEIAPGDTVAATENIFFRDGLDQAGIDRIAGLDEIVGVGPTGFFESGNILLGGAGSDAITGNGGDDIIDGDRWLNVRIRITGVGQANAADNQLATVDSLKHVFTQAEVGNNPLTAGWVGKSLFDLMIAQTIAPDQLNIVREVLQDGGGGGADTAIFRGNRSEYQIEGIDFDDDGDTQTTVRHLADANAVGHDGVDRLSNILRLQFADQVVELTPGVNAAPVGQPQIDGFAQVGQLLTIRLNPNGSLFGVTDADNIGSTNAAGEIFLPFIIEWQLEEAPGVFVDTGARGLSFTPAAGGELEVGADVRVRAIVRYNDAAGVPNSVASTPTEPLVLATNLVATEGDDVLVGTPQADTIDGLGGNDVIFGLADADVLIGGTGDDEIFGGLGNDSLAGGVGNDILDGGDGQDTAVFAGARANYTFAFNAEGQLEVVSSLAPEEDAVIGIEQFQFDDVTLTLAEALASLPTQATEGDDVIVGTAGDDEIDALGGNDTITALAGADVIVGGLGNDVIDAGEGDDVIAWAAGDGRDIIDGGAGTDRLRVRGAGSGETFFVETVTDYLARTGVAAETLRPTTDIIISRSVGAAASVVVAELNGVDNIDINGGGGNDAFVVSGDFAGTDLDPNTITIDGTTSNDTVDITGLQSAHRIVFRPNGGHDTIVGTVRPQDVVELLQGGQYVETVNPNGTKTLSNGTHSVTFQPGPGTDIPDACSDDDNDDDDDTGGNTPHPGSSTGSNIRGTIVADVLLGATGDDTIMALDGDDNAVSGDGADVVRGDDGDDFLSGQGGRDVVFGGSGDDDLFGGAANDMLYGDGGDDRIFGEDGNELIDAGSGDDTVYGGAGGDVIVAASGDGNDTYYGDEMSASVTGNDTLDMAAITANIGTGFMGRGSASSSQSGADTLWGIENLIAGSGNDTITMSDAVNIVDGGAGNDTFRFQSAADANGDTIHGFQTGDKIDLSGIDANAGTAANDTFTLVSGTGFTGVAQLLVSHETRADGDHTIVHGNTSGPDGDELRIDVKGHHNLSNSDFNL